MNFMGMIKWVVYSLVIIGALNWGLIGAFNFDLVSFFFGEMTFLTRVLYTIIGLSAIAYLITSLQERSEATHCGC
ncbi:MAG: DUF378 domain-containing protein [Candidatus Gastranaerophilales bacterium]|nr:DUF378 domain-containing protein [Candidatus Gastranaerophilales bacterium]